MARHVVALHGMVLVLLALPNTTVDAASSDASVLIQDLVHSRRVHNEAVHPNSSSASLHTSFDRDGCPAPKGYDQSPPPGLQPGRPSAGEHLRQLRTDA